MASKHQVGMLGVYLTAAELTSRGFIVSLTSRNAAGADLLVTDQLCRRTWSVQVKTSAKPVDFWPVSKNAESLSSDGHVYVFVNLRGESRPEYFVVPSCVVAANVFKRTKGEKIVWSSFRKKSIPQEGKGWGIFGDPGQLPEPEDDEVADEVNFSSA